MVREGVKFRTKEAEQPEVIRILQQARRSKNFLHDKAPQLRGFLLAGCRSNGYRPFGPKGTRPKIWGKRGPKALFYFYLII